MILENHIKYNITRLYNIYQKNTNKTTSFFNILKSFYPNATINDINEMYAFINHPILIDIEEIHKRKLSIILKKLPNSPLGLNSRRPSLSNFNFSNFITRRRSSSSEDD